MLEPGGREKLFMIVHNIVPNKARLFAKFHMVTTPLCDQGCGVSQDNVHLFTECVSVREVWGWVRRRVLDLLPSEASQTSNFELISLMFVPSVTEKEILFMMGHYVEMVWREVFCLKKALNLDFVKGHFNYCYKTHHNGRKPPLLPINGVTY